MNIIAFSCYYSYSFYIPSYNTVEFACILYGEKSTVVVLGSCCPWILKKNGLVHVSGKSVHYTMY